MSSGECLLLEDLARLLDDSPVSEQEAESIRDGRDSSLFHPVALDLMSTGGHWWTCVDAEPPEWYPYTDTTVTSRDELLPEHRPEIPETVEWSKYVEYNCREPECQDRCLNRADGVYAQTKLCRSCYPEKDIESLSPRSHHLPDWARGLDIDHTAATSEGEGEPVRPDAQATPRSGADEHPGPGRERPERPAPARRTGSAPSRGDPEARAHVSNPKGERPLHSDAHQSDESDSPDSGSAD